MKKSELIELIREVVYAELPIIIAEMQENNEQTIVESLSSTDDGQAQRERIRKIHGKRALPDAPPNRQLVVDYGGEKVASGKGVMDWFKGQVKEGNVGPTSQKKHTDDQMKNYMSKNFGKKIK